MTDLPPPVAEAFAAPGAGADAAAEAAPDAGVGASVMP